VPHIPALIWWCGLA